MESKLFAVSAATAILLCAVPGGFADAQTRPVTGSGRNVSLESVDTSRGLSLKVTKAKGNPYDDQREGQLPEGRLSGVRFKLSVAPDFPVTNDAEWKEASRARTDEEWDAIRREPVSTLVTDRNGEVTFTNLKPGLYLLEEIAPDTDHNYHVSAPRWIVLPLTDPYGENFVYENVMVVKPAPTTTPDAPPTTQGFPPTTPAEPSTPGVPPTSPGTPPPGTGETTSETPVPPGPPSEDAPPGAPGSPGSPGAPDSPRWLPETGANVLWAVVVGLMLVGFGVFMSRRNAE